MPLTKGPFYADQLAEGDPYELSNGHAILCMPSGGRGGKANLVGAQVLDTDPAVESAGIDTGFSPEPGMLRAPDVAVGNVPDEPGWVHGVPPLAVEYADTGQEEDKLQHKILDFLSAGTRYVWVVRLVGPKRVEVYEPGKKMRVVEAGKELVATGILKNPVPVLALFDRDVAHQMVLRNLLQREGYDSLEKMQAESETKGRVEGLVEGRVEGKAESILAVLAARCIPVSEEAQALILGTTDIKVLDRWIRKAAVVKSAEEILTREQDE